jgi:hypothetical protein
MACFNKMSTQSDGLVTPHFQKVNCSATVNKYQQIFLKVFAVPWLSSLYLPSFGY